MKFLFFVFFLNISFLQASDLIVVQCIDEEGNETPRVSFSLEEALSLKPFRYEEIAQIDDSYIPNEGLVLNSSSNDKELKLHIKYKFKGVCGQCPFPYQFWIKLDDEGEVHPEGKFAMSGVTFPTRTPVTCKNL